MTYASDPPQLADVFDLPTSNGHSTKPEQSWIERNYRKLSLDQRLDCLEHCIASLAQRDRNTLRRIGRAREVHSALSLKTAVKVQELGQMILEALDERSGNVFKLSLIHISEPTRPY